MRFDKLVNPRRTRKISALQASNTNEVCGFAIGCPAEFMTDIEGMLGPRFVKLLCLRVCKGLEALGLGLKIFSLCSDAVV